jgi:hypothetical protein
MRKIHKGEPRLFYCPLWMESGHLAPSVGYRLHSIRERTHREALAFAEFVSAKPFDIAGRIG